MNVGAHPFDKPLSPSSANVTLKPLNTDLYLAASTCKRHFTKSNGTTMVCVVPHEITPPKPHSAKYLVDPNSHESTRKKESELLKFVHKQKA